MKLVFVSNYFNHHQLSFCDALYELLEGSFRFLQTQPMEEERIRMGWQAEERPYVCCLSENSGEDFQRLILEADVVIFGGCDDESYIQQRLVAGKPIFRYNERMYKEGQWKAVSPRGLIQKYKDHTRYRKAPVYFLCAGAYVPCDYALIHAYPGKMLRFGYFPETKEYAKGQPFDRKQPGSILWAARMIDWKHPELPVRTAAYLKEHLQGVPFQMNIIGGGELEEEMHWLAEELQVTDVVSFLGFRDPEEVRTAMEESQIYLVTSDRKEGWGAVVNEAMNSGCAVVADHMIGAAPYLIRQEENGLMYRDGCEEELFHTVEQLLRDPEKCRRLGEAAQRSITTVWNARTAAGRLVRLCREQGFLPAKQENADMLSNAIGAEMQATGSEPVPAANNRSSISSTNGTISAPAIPQLWADGPCSPAPVIPERKMYSTCMQRQ